MYKFEFSINDELKNLIRPLNEEEYERLKSSITEEEKCRDPLILWDNGDENILIDGHNRYEIMLNCGKKIEYSVLKMKFNDINSVKIWMINNQMAKRNLNDKEKSYLIGKEYEINKKPIGKSVNSDEISERTGEKIGKKYNLSEKSVRSYEKYAKAVDDVVDNTGIDKHKIFDLNLTKKDLIKVSNCDAEFQKKVLGKIVEKNEKVSNNRGVIDDVLKSDFKKVVLDINRTEIKKNLIEKSLGFDEKDIQIINADFRNYVKDNVSDNSVDAIITDPPYPKEFLHLYKDLADVSYRVLKPSGFCIVYCGHIYLNQIMRYFDDAGLEYYWIYALVNSKDKRPTAIKRNAICGWKPIIIYQKPPLKPSPFRFVDYIDYDNSEKDLHEWQQGIKGYEHFIEKFTYPNDLILEPFAGGGTVPLACKKLKRKCIAIEIDEEMIPIIKGRLNDF